ncbi:hypothetical protein IWZ03DRAFT_414183 [Phyllosticta citriasiana]|uniref:Uncharacterized protein n=1 Tax=Phyllosticta citriasiana TaxID=595635 RepID=A0ABR1KN15_9PEZI
MGRRAEFKSLQNQLASAHKTISELKGKLGAAGDSEAQFLKENNVLHRLVHSSARSAPPVKFEMPEQSGPDLQLEQMTSTGKLDELSDMEEITAILFVQSASRELRSKDRELDALQKSAVDDPPAQSSIPEQICPDWQLDSMISAGTLEEMSDTEDSPAIMLVQSASKELQTLSTQVEEKDEELAELKKERTMLVRLVQRGQLDYPPQSFDLESAATSLQGLPIGTLTPED